MGFCLDPSDFNLRIIGLSVGPFRAYPYDYPERMGSRLILLGFKESYLLDSAPIQTSIQDLAEVILHL